MQPLLADAASLSPYQRLSMQDMIHRASMGNFSAPSMKPGGGIPFILILIFCFTCP
jgi:hypothetical protein